MDSAKPGVIPEKFLARLSKFVRADEFQVLRDSFSIKRPTNIRVNTLKASLAEVEQFLTNHNISFRKISWSQDAFVLLEISTRELGEFSIVKDGLVYIQNLSSMLPVLVLDPQPGERVLDACAAPGSKTTQISALMKNEGEIVAVECIRERYFKLKSVISQLGVKNVKPVMIDARRYKSSELFDRILVDAQCSCEARFSTHDKKTVGFWSERKIGEMAHKQKGILLNVARLLKPGGVLVYSTCTFAPEENEAVLDWLLKKSDNMQLVEVNLPNIKRLPAIEVWKNRNFNPEVKKSFRVMPDELMEGFFIAKIIKK